MFILPNPITIVNWSWACNVQINIAFVDIINNNSINIGETCGEQIWVDALNC